MFEWFCKFGLFFVIILLDKNIIRNEYDAVIPIDEIIISVNIDSIFDEIIFSIIISFEKYPEVKGNPINAILVILSVDKVDGIFDLFILIIRIS